LRSIRRYQDIQLIGLIENDAINYARGIVVLRAPGGHSNDQGNDDASDSNDAEEATLVTFLHVLERRKLKNWKSAVCIADMNKNRLGLQVNAKSQQRRPQKRMLASAIHSEMVEGQRIPVTIPLEGRFRIPTPVSTKLKSAAAASSSLRRTP
jgi:hypothetical protein